jgi:hypothetical protein
MGISVIPCGGKVSIDRPALIFKSLGIPVYALWDGDEAGHDSNPADNHRLLRVFDRAVEDWPDFVDNSCACFKNNLETTLEAEIGGAAFIELLKAQQVAIGIPKKKHALKNPIVVERIIRGAIDQGKNSATLSSIVEKIVALKN